MTVSLLDAALFFGFYMSQKRGEWLKLPDKQINERFYDQDVKTYRFSEWVDSVLMLDHVEQSSLIAQRSKQKRLGQRFKANNFILIIEWEACALIAFQGLGYEVGGAQSFFF